MATNKIRLETKNRRYDDNAAVIIDQKRNSKGVQVFGAIAEELKELNFMKIVKKTCMVES